MPVSTTRRTARYRNDCRLPSRPSGNSRYMPISSASCSAYRRPALDVGIHHQRAVQHRRTLRLQRERDLQVVPRQALVIGQRRQRPLRPDRGVGEVDVVGARASAVEAAGLRVATRCTELDVGGTRRTSTGVRGSTAKSSGRRDGSRPPARSGPRAARRGLRRCWDRASADPW